MPKRIVNVVLLCFSGYLIMCQEASFEDIYINPKIGYYNWFKEEGGWIKGIEVGALRNRIIYSADFYSYKEWALVSPTPYEAFNQIGMMVGRHIADRVFRITCHSGLTAVWGTKRSSIRNPNQSIYADYYQVKIL